MTETYLATPPAPINNYGALAIVQPTLNDIGNCAPQEEWTPEEQLFKFVTHKGDPWWIFPTLTLSGQIGLLAKNGSDALEDDEKRLATFYAALTGNTLLLENFVLDARTAGYMKAWWNRADTREVPELMPRPDAQVNVAVHLKIFAWVAEQVIPCYLRAASEEERIAMAVPHYFIQQLFKKHPDVYSSMMELYASVEGQVRVVKECVTAFAMLHQVRVHSAWIVKSPSAALLAHIVRSDQRCRTEERIRLAR